MKTHLRKEREIKIKERLLNESNSFLYVSQALNVHPRVVYNICKKYNITPHNKEFLKSVIDYILNPSTSLRTLRENFNLKPNSISIILRGKYETNIDNIKYPIKKSKKCVNNIKFIKEISKCESRLELLTILEECSKTEADALIVLVDRNIPFIFKDSIILFKEDIDNIEKRIKQIDKLAKKYVNTKDYDYGKELYELIDEYKIPPYFILKGVYKEV